jgi:hypothetical protein
MGAGTPRQNVASACIKAANMLNALHLSSLVHAALSVLNLCSRAKSRGRSGGKDETAKRHHMRWQPRRGSTANAKIATVLMQQDGAIETAIEGKNAGHFRTSSSFLQA